MAQHSASGVLACLQTGQLLSVLTYSERPLMKERAMTRKPTTEDGHHTLHLVFHCDDYTEVHSEIKWEPNWSLPFPTASFRLGHGVVMHVANTVHNAFPVEDGGWGDLVMDGRLLADGTIMPLTSEHVRDLLTEVGLSAF